MHVIFPLSALKAHFNPCPPPSGRTWFGRIVPLLYFLQKVAIKAKVCYCFLTVKNVFSCHLYIHAPFISTSGIEKNTYNSIVWFPIKPKYCTSIHQYGTKYNSVGYCVTEHVSWQWAHPEYISTLSFKKNNNKKDLTYMSLIFCTCTYMSMYTTQHFFITCETSVISFKSCFKWATDIFRVDPIN